MGCLDQDTGPVPGVGLTPARTAMVEAHQDFEPLFDDFV